MSESSRTDDSVPSLSSYPPAFVSLITTFIRRAEEAETRAHKALVILKAKDDQVLQLQQRMEVLEKIACRLEEVMVPPLDLPKSPQSSEEFNGPHTRDVNPKPSNHPPLETLYERFPNTPQKKDDSFVQDIHNCYEKCQHLIDGLERSNCQLREALAAEGQQRVKDHEQYVETLTKVTQAVKELQNNRDHTENPSSVNQALKHENLAASVFNEVTSVLKAAGDTDAKYHLGLGEIGKNDSSTVSNRIALLDKEELKKKVDLAESIISVLQNRLEKGQNKTIKTVIAKRMKRTVCNISSKGSLTSSYHTSKSSSSFKIKRKHSSSHCIINSLKKQNKKLKLKYQHMSKKFSESLNLCDQLQKEVRILKSKNKTLQSLPKVEKSIQTENMFLASSFRDRPDKPMTLRSVNILQGRLEAAAKVMAKQCKQIQDLQKQLVESHGQVECLRKRLARAESMVAGKELLGETTRKQLQDTENRNRTLTQELQQIKDSVNSLRQELSLQTEENSMIKKEKEMCESSFEDMRRELESKLLSLGSALERKEEVSNQMTNELEGKLISLREQFIMQVTEASDRLVAADFKIQELYLGIETFLKLLFSLNSAELSPSSQAQAVQVASDILQLPPGQVQTILHSSRCDNHRVNRWIRECNRLVHNKVFAKNLGHLLLDAVFEAKIA